MFFLSVAHLPFTIAESTRSRSRRDLSGTSSAARQRIQEMEERIRSLERMARTTVEPRVPVTSLASPVLGHTEDGVSMPFVSEEDMTNPPPPY